MGRMLTVAAALVFAVSCSVKQERTSCPCWLDLSVAGGDEGSAAVSIWNGSAYDSTVVRSVGNHVRFEWKVPKGEYLLSAFSGLHDCVFDGYRIIVRDGDDMDEIYAASMPLVAEGETTEASLSMHKQFAVVNMVFANTKGKEYPYNVRVRGNKVGLDLRDMSSIDGTFDIELNPVMGTWCKVCVPRQDDESLILEFIPKDASKGDDSVSGILSLGEAIRKTGYDWNAPDLDDIYLDVDYAIAAFRLSIRGWDEGGSFEPCY